jgi:hypothetical protein
VLRALSLCTCCRQYPGAAIGRRLRSSHPVVSAFPEIAVGSACTSTFSGLARRSLALRPAHSRRHLYVTCYTEGFSHFVTSMTAPVASGWSVRRVGLAPTGKRRLLTAHANSGQSLATRRACQIDPRRNFRLHRACGRLRRQAETTNRGYRGTSPKMYTMTKEKVDSRPKTSGKRICRREGLKLGAASMVMSLRPLSGWAAT